jgi:hypothetical protein
MTDIGIDEHIRTFFIGHDISDQQWPKGPGPERLPSLRVLAVSPGPRSKIWTYVTCGAWEASQKNPFEYLMTSDQPSSRYVELLTIVAFFALTHDLGVGHTMDIGEPLLPGSPCRDVYLSLPYTFGPQLERIRRDGQDGQILWVFPLTLSEKVYLLANGVDALEDRLENSGVKYWTPFRPPVV